MIRVSRPVRVGASFVGVAAVFALAGCAGDADAATTDAASDSTSDSSTSESATSGGSSAAYADGTYTAEGSYQTPESVETISVTLTIADGTVTEVEVVGDPQLPESKQYQSMFIGGIADEVVGKSVDDIEVSRVAGSSLTSGGFNTAVEAILADASA